MFFGAFHLALGLALFACAYLLGGPAWVLAWPAWSVMVVGAGYLGLGARVFGKRAADGRLSPLALALLLPYFAVAWTLWQLKSRFGSEPAWHEVAPGLWLGRRPLGPAELPAGARCVVDLTAEFPRVSPLGAAEPARYVCLPTLDTSAPCDEALAALVEALREDEGPLFIHCAMGHGRSATVAAALLIARGLARDVDDAVARLRAVRPGVHLHGAQRAAVARLIAAAGQAKGAAPDPGARVA
jgi:hypothetical protein